MMTNSKAAQFNETTNEHSAVSRDALLYLLIGGGIGAAVALLFAPKAGVKLRSDISEITKKKYDETLEAASQLKQKTSGLYQAAKEKTDRAYEFAAAKLNRVQGDMSRTIGKPTDHINGEILEISTGTGEEPQSSSNIV